MGKYDKYIEAWRKRLTQEQNKHNKRIDEMHQIAMQCAEYLALHFDVKRVYLFGSLVREKFIHSRSDIDLAVEGLAAPVYFKTLSELWDLLPPGIELDLVPIEDAHPQFKQKILKEGKLLYERKQL